MGSAVEVPKLGIKTQELVDRVEALLIEAYDLMRAGKEFGAVNWGDLGVHQVEYRWPVYPAGKPYAVVLVEEASPDCKLAGWLSTAISADFPYCHVECEW